MLNFPKHWRKHGRTALTLGAVCSAVMSASAARADDRQMVEMPPPMQEHMLGNMRGHLQALDGILGALGAGNVGEAGSIAEKELGLSSLDDHGSAHLAQFMPEGMQAAGTDLHRAASRFAVAAADAELEHTYEAQQAVFSALQDITAACTACHGSYRIR